MLDYIAMAFILLGYFRMGTLKIDGWLWMCLGCILLAIFGISNAMMGLVIGNAILAGLAIRGFIKGWRSLK